MRAVTLLDMEDETLPGVVRGLLFLANSSLNPTERATIVAGLEGDWTIGAVLDRMKDIWSDNEINQHDNMLKQASRDHHEIRRGRD